MICTKTPRHEVFRFFLYVRYAQRLLREPPFVPLWSNQSVAKIGARPDEGCFCTKAIWLPVRWWLTLSYVS